MDASPFIHVMYVTIMLMKCGWAFGQVDLFLLFPPLTDKELLLTIQSICQYWRSFIVNVCECVLRANNCNLTFLGIK